MQLEYVSGTKQVKHRYIQMADTPTIEKFNTSPPKVEGGTIEKFQPSPTKVDDPPIQKSLRIIIQLNTTSNNTKNKGRFTPPTLTEVIDQCNFSGANIDPQGFIDFYESKGWMIGKQQDEVLEVCYQDMG